MVVWADLLCNFSVFTSSKGSILSSGQNLRHIFEGHSLMQLMGASAVRGRTSCELFTNVLAGLCSHNIRTTIKLIADENNQKHRINT